MKHQGKELASSATASFSTVCAPCGVCACTEKGVSYRLAVFRAQELCEGRGGRPGLSVPNIPYGLCGLTEEKEKKTRCLHQAFQTCGILVELEVQSCIEYEQRTNTFNQVRVINSLVRSCCLTLFVVMFVKLDWSDPFVGGL